MARPGQADRTMERVERMMKEQEDKDRAERIAQAAKHRSDSIHQDTKSVAQSHFRAHPEAKPKPYVRTPEAVPTKTAPAVQPSHGKQMPSQPRVSSSNSSVESGATKLKFSKLAQAVEAELAARQSRAAPRGFRSPGRPDPTCFKPLPDEDV